MLSQCLLGLRQLNALPTDLDLKILSSQILQLPIPPPANKIAGPEQPASRSAKEIGYKAFRCQGRLVPIPMPSNRLAFHIEFPCHTYRTNRCCSSSTCSRKSLIGLPIGTNPPSASCWPGTL